MKIIIIMIYYSSIDKKNENKIKWGYFSNTYTV